MNNIEKRVLTIRLLEDMGQYSSFSKTLGLVNASHYTKHEQKTNYKKGVREKE